MRSQDVLRSATMRLQSVVVRSPPSASRTYWRRAAVSRFAKRRIHFQSLKRVDNMSSQRLQGLAVLAFGAGFGYLAASGAFSAPRDASAAVAAPTKSVSTGN